MCLAVDFVQRGPELTAKDGLVANTCMVVSALCTGWISSDAVPRDQRHDAPVVPRACRQVGKAVPDKRSSKVASTTARATEHITIVMCTVRSACELRPCGAVCQVATGLCTAISTCSWERYGQLELVCGRRAFLGLALDMLERTCSWLPEAELAGVRRLHNDVRKILGAPIVATRRAGLAVFPSSAQLSDATMQDSLSSSPGKKACIAMPDPGESAFQGLFMCVSRPKQQGDTRFSSCRR